MNKIENIIIIPALLFLSLLTISSPGSGANAPAVPPASSIEREKPSPEPWQQKWNRILAEARKEGRAMAYGNFSTEEKAAVSKGLKAKYGIEMEWVTGNSSQVINKINNERTAGLYLVDIFASGVAGAVDMLKPKGYLQKLDDAVILPEVKDPKVWLGNKFPWFDQDHTNIAFVGYVMPDIIVNTELVKEGEITGYQDLLNPKWKGKIVMFNPTITGSMLAWFTVMGQKVGGETYMRTLVKQEPVILSDNRLAVEWVARGKSSIGLALRLDEIISFARVGAPIRIVSAKEGGYLSTGHGTVSLFNKAPHPNAAIVYLNYLLSREGQTAYSKEGRSAVRRLDVPTDHLDPSTIPVPGRSYLDMNENFALVQLENMELAKKIFGPLLR